MRSFLLAKRLVSARVAFIPISQSDQARHSAACARPSISEPGTSASKPLRIAAAVIDCSHSRWIGFSTPRYFTTSRKISSPSRPASQALISRSTSSRCTSFWMVRMRSLWPFFFLSEKVSGMMGSTSRVQRLYFSSTSSGGGSSKRWPTAKVST